jgi:hypothetical protein
MKKYILLMMTSGLLISSCQQVSKEDVAENISGTYINQSKSNWSVAMDTVVISPYHSQSGTVIIIRKTGFNRIKNGLLEPKEYEEDSSVAVLDIVKNQLQEIRHGRIYTYLGSYDELLIGAIRYRKVQ